nr:hypothetical protein [Spirochaetaceae bacterium]
PFFPAGRLMLLVSLTMTILPLLQQENRQLSDALKSRGLAKHPSPFRRLYYHSQPLINGVMRLSDKIAQALYSRCLNKNPTLLGPDLTMGDYLLITAAFLFLGLGLYLKYYILR